MRIVLKHRNMVKIRSIRWGLRSKAYASCFTKKIISPSFSQAMYDAQTLLYNITQFLACLKRHKKSNIYYVYGKVSRE